LDSARKALPVVAETFGIKSSLFFTT
jgi:hypothetical protein